MATRRSHPPTLETIVRGTLRQEGVPVPGSTVLVAVSGGPDSMALLHVLARLAPRLGFTVRAHGVDHGLRAEASEELQLAATLAAGLGVAMTTSVLSVAPGGNLQARARQARLGALRGEARRVGAAWIATGHHADDRAETVLMRLLQGSGPRGLGCLPVRDGDLVRPMLRARRQDVEAHLARHGVPYASDPSNKNSRFVRVRIRHEVMPLLEAMSPSVVAHLNALADELIEARESFESELNRAQRAQVKAAARSGRAGVNVKMKQGREVWVAVAQGEAMLSLSKLGQTRGQVVTRSSTPGPADGTLSRELSTPTARTLGSAKGRP